MNSLERHCARFFRENGREARGMVYIDGLNFYSRALRRTGRKWLDPQEWARCALPIDCDLAAVHYFTSKIKNLADPDAPIRQEIYLDALQDWTAVRAPGLHVHHGVYNWEKSRGRLRGESWTEDACRWLGFQARRLWARLLRRPPPDRKMADITFPGEKRTDVNLAVRMTADAAADRFDFAVLVSTDSDFVGLCGAIRKEYGKALFLAVPPKMARKRLSAKNKGVAALRENANGVISILDEHLAAAQMPDEFPAADGKRTHEKPRSWR